MYLMPDSYRHTSCSVIENSNKRPWCTSHSLLNTIQICIAELWNHRSVLLDFPGQACLYTTLKHIPHLGDFWRAIFWTWRVQHCFPLVLKPYTLVPLKNGKIQKWNWVGQHSMDLCPILAYCPCLGTFLCQEAHRRPSMTSSSEVVQVGDDTKRFKALSIMFHIICG